MPRNPFEVNGSGSIPNPDRIGFLPRDKEVVATRSVKLKSKATVQKEQEIQEREEYAARFEDNANKTIQYHTERDKKVVEIISGYLRMIDDKTLSRNRGSIANDVEREIRERVIQLALDLNNDENEEDNGKGAVVVLIAVTKVLTKYRDRLNDLEFEVQKMGKEISKLSSQLAQQTSNATK